MLGKFCGLYLTPFSSTPFTCYFLFVRRSCKEVKGRKGKRKGYLETQFLSSGFTTTSWWWEFFSEPAEIIILPTQGIWRISWNHFWQIASWGSTMCLCVQWICSAEAVTSRRHNARLNHRDLASTCVSSLAAERKRCFCLSRGGKGFWERVSL